MGFINNLKNIEPIHLNNSLINNSSNIVQNSINNANNSTGGIWFIVTIIVIFIWLMYILMDKNKTFQYDPTRALFISSSWCLSLSIVSALIGISITIIPIIWFGTIFFISGVGVYMRKEKNM
jgi:hypothetical protein